jgi:hypothetical protein
VADLVERRREDDGAEEHDQQRRVVDHLARRAGDAVMEQQPAVER